MQKTSYFHANAHVGYSKPHWLKFGTTFIRLFSIKDFATYVYLNLTNKINKNLILNIFPLQCFKNTAMSTLEEFKLQIKQRDTSIQFSTQEEQNRKQQLILIIPSLNDLSTEILSYLIFLIIKILFKESAKVSALPQMFLNTETNIFRLWQPTYIIPMVTEVILTSCLSLLQAKDPSDINILMMLLLNNKVRHIWG